MTISNKRWQRLRQGDVTAWRELLPQVLPLAIEILRDGFRLPAQEDVTDGPGAVLSAWSSFQRHFEVEGRFLDAQDLETLASQLVRIAYNRAQRRKRQSRRFRSLSPVEQQFHAPGQPPDAEVTRAEYCRLLRSLVGEEVERLGRESKRFQVVRTWLSSNLSARQKELAEQVGVRQSTVQRYLKEFKERIRQRVLANEHRDLRREQP